ncbi:hypothetical protein NKH77_01250 [Streptomyces sp. M19]
MLGEIETAGAQALSRCGPWSASCATPPPRGDPPTGDLRRVGDLTKEFAATGQRAEFSLDPRLVEQPPPPEIAAAVHRVVRESLTNVRKHAAGTAAVRVRVALVTGAGGDWRWTSPTADPEGAAPHHGADPDVRSRDAKASAGSDWSG